jgi:integrase
MAGSVQYARHVKRYYVAWYQPVVVLQPDGTTKKKGKVYKIYTYKGEFMYSQKTGDKLLALMESDVENGTFRIERYLRGATDVVPYIRKWLETVSPTLSPATRKDYRNSIENHLAPFFEDKGVSLHEIEYDTLMELLGSIDREGKGRMNVIYCLHECLEYAVKSHRIARMPSFPERSKYQLVKTVIKWLPSPRQRAIIEAIPVDHQPIFWFLKYHLRRPGEAMALHKEDFENGVFTIHRSFSNKELVPKTKTGEIHITPMVGAFAPYLEIEMDKQRAAGIISPYFFVYPEGRKEGLHYTHKTLNTLWNNACKKAGENIRLYAGLKHSSAGQFINELGYSKSELKEAGDWSRLESVDKYAELELSRKRDLLEGTLHVIRPAEKKAEEE